MLKHILKHRPPALPWYGHARFLLRSAELPKPRRDAILKAFGRIKQRVIWKYEEDDDILDKLPPNVRVQKWLPQNDILGERWGDGRTEWAWQRGMNCFNTISACRPPQHPRLRLAQRRPQQPGGLLPRRAHPGGAVLRGPAGVRRED